MQRPAFNQKQQLFEREAMRRLEKVIELRDETDPAAAEELAAELERAGSPLVRLGEPGTGKTFVADYLIRWAQDQGLHVLYALPTGQLACRMRQRHPGLAVDTCAGAFLFHRPLLEALALLSEYDMVVIDKALQLSAEEFGRVNAMYLAAGKRLLLLLMGDDWQLPSICPQGAADHPQWRLCRFVTLTEARRCRCPELAAKLRAIRCLKPTGADGQRIVNKICARHKAWSGHDEPTALDVESVLDKTEGKPPS